MASSTPDPDGTEDVNDFLQRIRQLGEQRDKEDEERTKKLEEEILQGRRERQARRAGIIHLSFLFFCCLCSLELFCLTFHIPVFPSRG